MYCGSRPINLPADCDKRIFHAALTDARDACIGLDRDDHVALVEQRVGVWRQVRTHPGDLHFRERNSVSGQTTHAAGNCGGRQGPQEGSSFHDSTPFR